MASIRQQQVASMIQQTLGDIFIKDGRGIYGNAFVTITQVRMTPDLSIARIYLSVYNVEDKQDTVNVITENLYVLRKMLGNRLRNKLRRIPELEFYLDDSLDEVFKMEKLFKDLNDERGDREIKIDKSEYDGDLSDV